MMCRCCGPTSTGRGWPPCGRGRAPRRLFGTADCRLRAPIAACGGAPAKSRPRWGGSRRPRPRRREAQRQPLRSRRSAASDRLASLTSRAAIDLRGASLAPLRHRPPRVRPLACEHCPLTHRPTLRRVRERRKRRNASPLASMMRQRETRRLATQSRRSLLWRLPLQQLRLRRSPPSPPSSSPLRLRLASPASRAAPVGAARRSSPCDG
mmetsp:Transcript_22101/g.71520  ORF Transcript_22101/g.71520 Transcript_22101/m.71520 type:complete len:209 (+) Transcript_22101:983-1609(+)